MPESRTFHLVLCSLLLCATVVGTPARAAEASGQDGALIDALLEASGVGPSERAAATSRVQHAVERLVLDLGEGRASYRRASRLLRALHRDHLLDYHADADDLLATLDAGRFNCLSSTLLMALAARRAGYEPFVLESPRHVSLGIEFGGRMVQIETTVPDGFDTLRQVEESGAFYSTSLRGVPWFQWTARNGFGEHPVAPRRFTPDQAVGFLWLNAARRALDEGRALEAAHHALRAGDHLPEEVSRSEGVRLLLARAFRAEYEVGRFDAAYRIAEIDVRLFPRSTTSRDRLLAAGYKRVETACDAGEPTAAETLLDAVAEASPETHDVRRFEQRACPLIVAAAVREGRWDLARRVAVRYARVERDDVEAARLIDWVEQRSSGTIATPVAGESSCLGEVELGGCALDEFDPMFVRP